MSSVIVGAAALSWSGVVLWWSVAGDRRPRKRALRNLQAGLDDASRTTDLRQRMLEAPGLERIAVPFTGRLEAMARRVTPVGMVDKLNDKILLAGRAGTWPVERVLATKFLLGASGMLFGLLFITSGGQLAVLFGLTLPPFSFFLPDLMLGIKGKERQKRIRLSLPDTLDQITVCVEAGLGFEAALARSAKTGDGPLADELVRTLQDIQLGVPRRDALRRLSDRNTVEELRHFVLAILQAEGYGVPIARVLRIQSGELREKRRQAAEEHAMKISIKMLFPLVFCILPTVFIVILGPAIFQLMNSLGGAQI